jgi:hypothetical protein
LDGLTCRTSACICSTPKTTPDKTPTPRSRSPAGAVHAPEGPPRLWRRPSDAARLHRRHHQRLTALLHRLGRLRVGRDAVRGHQQHTNSERCLLVSLGTVLLALGSLAAFAASCTAGSPCPSHTLLTSHPCCSIAVCRCLTASGICWRSPPTPRAARASSSTWTGSWRRRPRTAHYIQAGTTRSDVWAPRCLLMFVNHFSLKPGETGVRGCTLAYSAAEHQHKAASGMGWCRYATPGLSGHDC